MPAAYVVRDSMCLLTVAAITKTLKADNAIVCGIKIHDERGPETESIAVAIVVLETVPAVYTQQRGGSERSN